MSMVKARQIIGHKIGQGAVKRSQHQFVVRRQVTSELLSGFAPNILFGIKTVLPI